jgi:hypothetical protein
MQLVGSSCSVCNRSINFASDGASCPNCAVSFHLGCLSAPGTCPRCGGNFAQLAAAQHHAAAMSRAHALGWGRNAVLSVCALLLGTQLLFVAIALFNGADPFVVVVQLISSLVFVAALYFGYESARIWLGLSSALGAIIAVSLAWTRADSLGVVLLLLGMAVLFATLSSLLLFSSRVALFLANQRQAT